MIHSISKIGVPSSDVSRELDQNWRSHRLTRPSVCERDGIESYGEIVPILPYLLNENMRYFSKTRRALPSEIIAAFFPAQAKSSDEESSDDGRPFSNDWIGQFYWLPARKIRAALRRAVGRSCQPLDVIAHILAEDGGPLPHRIDEHPCWTKALAFLERRHRPCSSLSP
jgi:hypothetical protein